MKIKANLLNKPVNFQMDDCQIEKVVELPRDQFSALVITTGERRGHTGMDLAVPTGTPIRAALPGTVTVSTYNRGGYGYYIMIDHGNGLSTLYGHCSQLLASVGRTVKAGDVIALSGSTGRSTGPHLHFEVRVNGQRTNPRSYLP